LCRKSRRAGRDALWGGKAKRFDRSASRRRHCSSRNVRPSSVQCAISATEPSAADRAAARLALRSNTWFVRAATAVNVKSPGHRSRSFRSPETASSSSIAGFGSWHCGRFSQTGRSAIAWTGRHRLGIARLARRRRRLHLQRRHAGPRHDFHSVRRDRAGYDAAGDRFTRARTRRRRDWNADRLSLTAAKVVRRAVVIRTLLRHRPTRAKSAEKRSIAQAAARGQRGRQNEPGHYSRFADHVATSSQTIGLEHFRQNRNGAFTSMPRNPDAPTNLARELTARQIAEERESASAFRIRSACPFWVNRSGRSDCNGGQRP
jgi:hypothetical protein